MGRGFYPTLESPIPRVEGKKIYPETAVFYLTPSISLLLFLCSTTKLPVGRTKQDIARRQASRCVDEVATRHPARFPSRRGWQDGEERRAGQARSAFRSSARSQGGPLERTAVPSPRG